jgi:hypothetical protein
MSDNIQVKDAAGLSKTVRTSDDGTAHTPHHIALPFADPSKNWQFAGATGGIVNTTDVVAKAAAGAGLRNYVTGIQFKNASNVATDLVIKDGSTVIWRGHMGTDFDDPGMIGVVFQTPLKGTANTAINVACTVSGAAVYVNLQGFVAA